MKERDYNKEVMVPLTSSLYVPGVLQGPNVLVEAGAGYFIEKNNADAMEYCNKKERALTENAKKVADYVNQKRAQMGKVQGEYNKRMLAMQAEAQEKKWRTQTINLAYDESPLKILYFFSLVVVN